MVAVLTVIALMATNWLPSVIGQRPSFISEGAINGGNRDVRQASADQMVQNILQWLQGIYTQNSRKIRQGTLREYLPPSNTQKPRPFEPLNNINHHHPPGFEDENNIIGYPPSGGTTPQPPFTPPVTGGNYPYPTPTPQVIPPDYSPGINGYAPAGETPQPPFPGPTPHEHPSTPPPVEPITYKEPPPPPYPAPAEPDYSTPPTHQPFPGTFPPPINTNEPYPTGPPIIGQPSEISTFPPITKEPSEDPLEGFPTRPPEVITNPPVPYQTSGPYPQPSPTDKYETSPPDVYNRPTEKVKTPEEPTYTSLPPIPGDNQPSEGEYKTTRQPPSDEDLLHPPHIHAIDVECAKDMMTINIEFNRQFDGVIYSKGFYNQPQCRYVNHNTGQIKYSFTVSLNSCGTEFVNAFDTQGQSYLENILVLQNEPGIQEVWDTIRSVRCLWEGNLNKALSISLSVGMLTQEIVTFSGDTAVARLDIQLGKGPFAPTATGLVKIGEQMTLVVSVTGDAGFDVQVKECKATDVSGDNEVALTDGDGCVLKPKLFGAFQKTRDVGNTGASIIAYAFFNAFKFPDIMELMIECNVELCKTDCDVCPNPDQRLEPGRRRRRREAHNDTVGEPVRVRKILKVLLPEDLSNGEAIINIEDSKSICMSVQGFVISSVLLITLFTATSLFSAFLWLKNQRAYVKKQKHFAN